MRLWVLYIEHKLGEPVRRRVANFYRQTRPLPGGGIQNTSTGNTATSSTTGEAFFALLTAPELLTIMAQLLASAEVMVSGNYRCAAENEGFHCPRQVFLWLVSNAWT